MELEYTQVNFYNLMKFKKQYPNYSYRPLPDFVTIKESTTEGLGLFSNKDIKYPFVLGISHVSTDLNGFKSSLIRTPLGGFVNHSEDSNVEMILSQYPEHKKKVWFYVTTKDVNKGDELFTDYSKTPCINETTKEDCKK